MTTVEEFVDDRSDGEVYEDSVVTGESKKDSKKIFVKRVAWGMRGCSSEPEVMEISTGME